MIYFEFDEYKILTKENLQIKINYTSVINSINEEINNPKVYNLNKNEKTYYLGTKKTKKDYIKSLTDIKELIDKIFCVNPTINIFDFIELSKKNLFKKSQKPHLASPIAGIISQWDGYKTYDCFYLSIEILDEKTAEIIFEFREFEKKKFNPIFFNDYNTPIIKTKLPTIKKADLKPGYIYSDEEHKNFWIYLGLGNLMFDICPTTASTKDIEEIAEAKIEKNLYYWKTKERFLYKKVSYNELYKYKKIIDKKITITPEEFLKTLNRWDDAYECKNSPKVFHEEYQYVLIDKPFTLIYKDTSTTGPRTDFIYFHISDKNFNKNRG